MCWCPSWSNSLWQGWSCRLVRCRGGNATEPIWRVLASSDEISSWTPLKPQDSIPCWLSVQWESSACRSCQCCRKKGSSNLCGCICSVWPSWVLGSQHASTGNSVLWSLSHSSLSCYHCIKTCGIWIDQLNHLPAVMTMSFFLIFSEQRWDKRHANLMSLQFLANNCVYSSHTDTKLCTYCLYGYTTVLIHEILYLAHQLWCSDFLTPPTPLIIPHRLPGSFESLILLKPWCSIHAKWSKSSLKHSRRFCVIFSKFKS